MSLYDDLGQERGIGVAVDDFYRRVLADPVVSHHFSGIDLERLRHHQTALLVQVTGGPQRYSGRSLELAHRRLAITADDFDRVVGHLGATLADLGVDAASTDVVAGALESHRSEIVGTADAPGSGTDGRGAGPTTEHDDDARGGGAWTPRG